MTATRALQLPALPGPDTPVIPAHRVVDGYTGPIACFADPSWPLIPMNGNPGVTQNTIHLASFPEALREEMRLLVWMLINNELSSVFLRARSPSWRSQQGPESTNKTVGVWARLAEWLTERGITKLSDCTSHVLGEYGHTLRDSGASRITVHYMLASMTRLWAFDQLSSRPSGIGCPPWETEGVDDYLPAATAEGENTTEAIAEQTMGPMLIWAIRMVEDFSDDILTAWAEMERLRAAAAANKSTPASLASLKAFMEPLLAGDLPIPAVTWRGKPALARTYIAAITGASHNQVTATSKRLGWRQAAVRRPGPCPLKTSVTGMLGGKPWREALDYHECASLTRQLGTACFIVIAYLTGMRPGENGAELHLMQHSAGSKYA